MPYSEMFPNPAQRRARVLERAATKYQHIRVLYSDILDDLTELRDEPDKVLARHVVEALRVDPREAHAMLRAASAIAETVTPTGHTTPAPLPLVREAGRAGVVGVAHIDEIAKVMAELPTRVSVAERDAVQAALTDAARVYP